MATHRQLKTPPIVEAVIDFRVKLRSQVDGTSLTKVTPEFKAKFPKAALMRQRAFQVTFGEDAPPNPNPAKEVISGARFDSANKEQVAIFTLEGFTLSNVLNYSTWPEFKEQAIESWNEYCKLADPQEIVRVGLRYINRLDFPAPVELSNFFTAAPSLPPELPQIIGPFHSRVLFPLSDGIGMGSLTHVLNPTIGSDISVILDIDIYQEGLNYEASKANAWDLLDKFRVQKNNVFFASLTDKALEKYL